MKKKAKKVTGRTPERGQPYPLELRLSVVKAIVEGGATVLGAAAAFKIGPLSVRMRRSRMSRPICSAPALEGETCESHRHCIADLACDSERAVCVREPPWCDGA